MFIKDSQLSMSGKAHLSVCPTSEWRHYQGVLCLVLKFSLKRLHLFAAMFSYEYINR